MTMGANGALKYFTEELGLNNPRSIIENEIDNFLGVRGSVNFLSLPYLKSVLEKGWGKKINAQSHKCDYSFFPDGKDPLGISKYIMDQKSVKINVIQHEMIQTAKGLSIEYQPTTERIAKTKYSFWKKLKSGCTESRLRAEEQSELLTSMRSLLEDKLTPMFKELKSLFGEEFSIDDGYSTKIDFEPFGYLSIKLCDDEKRIEWKYKNQGIGRFCTTLIAEPARFMFAKKIIDGIPNHPLIDGISNNLFRIEIDIPAEKPLLRLIAKTEENDPDYFIFARKTAEFDEKMLEEARDLLLL